MYLRSSAIANTQSVIEKCVRGIGKGEYVLAILMNLLKDFDTLCKVFSITKYKKLKAIKKSVNKEIYHH